MIIFYFYYDIFYSECSALKNINIDDVFHQASQLIYDYYVINDDEDLLEFEDGHEKEEDEEEEEEEIIEYTDDNDNDCYDESISFVFRQ